MIEIKIDQFLGYDADAFYEFLKMEQDPNVRIKLPKKTALFESDVQEIALEYAVMALVGQRVFDLEGNFYMKYPPMNGRAPFVFELKTEKRKALAALLAWMAGFYEGNEEKRSTYYQEAESFIYHLDGIEVGCVEYVAVAHQFLLMHLEDRERQTGDFE